MNRFRVVAALVCIIFLFSLFLIPFANADWNMFLSDPSHSGAGTGKPILTPTLLWNYTTGNMVASSPAIVKGVVYIGSDDNNLYAFNAATGAKIWNYTTSLYVGASPAVVDGIVYIGSYDHNIYALNATNGAKIWNYTTNGQVASSPAVVDGVLYIGSFDGNIYALGSPTLPPSSTSSETLFIAIGVVVAVVIVAAVVFLMFKKRLKTKLTNSPSQTHNSTSDSCPNILKVALELAAR